MTCATPGQTRAVLPAVTHPPHPTRVYGPALTPHHSFAFPYCVVFCTHTGRMAPGVRRELGGCMSTHPSLLQRSAAAGSSSRHLVASTAQTSSFRYYSSRLCVFSFAFLPRRSELISCRSHPLLSFSLSYRGFCAPSVFPSAPLTFQRALLLCPVGDSWFTCQCQERGTLSLSSPSKVCIVLLAITNASMTPTPRPLLTSVSAGTGVPVVTKEHADGWQMGRFQ